MKVINHLFIVVTEVLYKSTYTTSMLLKSLYTRTLFLTGILFLTSTNLCATEILTPSSATISGDSAQGVTTTSTSFSDALSVTANIPSTASVLVMGTFSIESDGGGQTRDSLWQLTYASQTSTPMRRYLSGINDAGNGSALHIFTNVPPGDNVFNIQHATGTSGRDTTMFGANLIAIPLATDQGSLLNSGISFLTSTSSVSSTNFADLGITTTVTVDNVSTSNSIFLASSLNSKSTGTPVEGEWMLQYRHSGGAWLDAGMGARRYLSGSSDHGAVSIYSLVADLTNGIYEVRITGRSLTDAITVQTYNATIAAVSLSYTNALETGFFPAISDSAGPSTNSSSVWSPISGLECDLISTTNSNYITAISLAGKTETGSNNTGEFRIAMTNSTGQVQLTVDTERFFAGGNDWGSIGLVGLFTNVPAGTNTFRGEQQRTGGATLTSYPELVALSTISMSKGKQTISFPNPGAQETTNSVILTATADSSLPVTLIVSSGPANLSGGSNLTFTATGTVALVASQSGDSNWHAAPDVTNTFSVTKAIALVTLSDTNQIYDSTPRVVTATTDPGGLTVDITYDGSPIAPTNVGTYAVTGTVNEVMYQGITTGTLMVLPKPPEISNISIPTTSNFVLQWLSVSNAIYSIDRATNFLDPSPWTSYATNIISTPIINIYTGDLDNFKESYYKIKATAE